MKKVLKVKFLHVYTMKFDVYTFDDDWLNKYSWLFKTRSEYHAGCKICREIFYIYKGEKAIWKHANSRSHYSRTLIQHWVNNMDSTDGKFILIESTNKIND